MSFIFLGNHLATDFVNTEAIGQQTRLNLIETPDLLSSWLTEAGIKDAVRCTHKDLQEATELRRTIRNCFEHLVESRPLTAHDLSLLNKMSNELRTYLQNEGDRYALVNRIETASDACALIARATCNLIASPQCVALRKCASDKCILYFIDTSKNQQRQWCSMELCGNRKKAQKHYHKNKPTKENQS
jgi:predicted RNA-binding Zn ribbon-like protein